MPDNFLALTVIALSLVFTYTNGLQDGSSVTASVISCRAMSAGRAILVVTICEFAGALLGGSAVAHAVRSISNYPENPNILPVLAAGLTAAIAGNWMTKILKFPSSSTHALFGGLIGGLLAASGSQYLIWGDPSINHPSGIYRIIISLFASPLLGFIAGYGLLKLCTIVPVRAKNRINKFLKGAQAITVGVLAFGHGANDPQKAMGIILIALHASGMYAGDEIPLWVRIATGASIAAGVASLAPGIVKKVGKIYRLRILHGFVTESAAGGLVLWSSLVGFPVSTSQVISSTVMGVGSCERAKDVHWIVARDILVSWFLTMPLAGLLAFLIYFAIFHGLPH